MDTKTENAIALSAEFHTHSHYMEFYDALGEDLCGFTGIYQLIDEMADAMTHFEQGKRINTVYTAGEVYEEESAQCRGWIEWVEWYVDMLIHSALDGENYCPDLIFEQVKKEMKEET